MFCGCNFTESTMSERQLVARCCCRCIACSVHFNFNCPSWVEIGRNLCHVASKNMQCMQFILLLSNAFRMDKKNTWCWSKSMIPRLDKYELPVDKRTSLNRLKDEWSLCRWYSKLWHSYFTRSVHFLLLLWRFIHYKRHKSWHEKICTDQNQQKK